MSSSHVCSTQSQESQFLSCSVQESMGAELRCWAAALALEQQWHHLEKLPHARQPCGGQEETSKTTSKQSSQGPWAPPCPVKLSHFHGVNNTDKITASWHGASLPWFPVPAPSLLPKSTGAMRTSCSGRPRNYGSKYVLASKEKCLI